MKGATKKDSANTRALPKKAAIPSLFYVATRNTQTGELYLKLVNTSDKAQPVTIVLNGAAKERSERQQKNRNGKRGQKGESAVFDAAGHGLSSCGSQL